jgi:threonine dehydratase
VSLSEEYLAGGSAWRSIFTHNSAEGAGRIARRGREVCRSLRGQRVVSVMSGGNLDLARLRPFHERHLICA